MCWLPPTIPEHYGSSPRLYPTGEQPVSGAILVQYLELHGRVLHLGAHDNILSRQLAVAMNLGLHFIEGTRAVGSGWHGNCPSE